MDTNIFLHRSYLRDKQKCRRGMVLFYRQQHTQRIAKVFASKQFDIVWLRLATKSGLIYICFFYAPGAHHEEGFRTIFYNTLCRSFEKFGKLGRVFVLCDSNARLGKFTDDRNIHGIHIKNKNCNLFTGFLEYSGLVLLNRIYAFGKPTYEILKERRSIIDYGLTNAKSIIENFEVLPIHLGTSPQTCHKIIRLTLNIGINKEIIPSSISERRIF